MHTSAASLFFGSPKSVELVQWLVCPKVQFHLPIWQKDLSGKKSYARILTGWKLKNSSFCGSLLNISNAFATSSIANFLLPSSLTPLLKAAVNSWGKFWKIRAEFKCSRSLNVKHEPLKCQRAEREAVNIIWRLIVPLNWMSGPVSKFG